jgi:hypothetical protein
MSRSKKRKTADGVGNDALLASNNVEYVVSEIVDHAGNINDKNKMKFKVHWEGYSSKSDTWEPFAHVCNLVQLDKYIAQHPELSKLNAKPAEQEAEKEK